jgi:tRNA A-37 threonylcarbamoyl transferase component Bud32
VNNRVTLSPPFDRLWKDQDPFDAAFALNGKVYRELESRRTLRFEINGKGYFAKLHHGVGWWVIIREVLRLRSPVTSAQTEYSALALLEKIGVPSMHPVAFGVRGRNPAHQDSFLITEELTNTASLEDFCKEWPSHPPNGNLKRGIINQVAQMVRRMHAAGMNHRDCYLVHFLLHLESINNNAPKISLIDLHRAQIHPLPLPQRWRNKDLAALAYSSSLIGLTKKDRYRFLKIYFQKPLKEIFLVEQPLIQFLEKETARLTARWNKRFSARALADKGQWHIAANAPNSARHAWPTLSAVFDSQALRISKDPLSDVLKAEVDGEIYYVKRYTGAGKHLRRWVGRSRVQAEWENLKHFQTWNIPTAELVAFGQERQLFGFGRGALITREIKRTTDLAKIANTNDPRLQDQAWVRAVFTQVAAITRNLHQHGFAHNDLKWRNLLVDDQPQPTVYLIDCPSGMFWPWPFLQFKIIKDLACLDKVAQFTLSRTQRLRFYLAYTQHTQLNVADKHRIRKILKFFYGRL